MMSMFEWILIGLAIYMLINAWLALIVDQAWEAAGYGEVDSHGSTRTGTVIMMILFGIFITILAPFVREK